MLTPADAFRSIDCAICVMLYRHVEDMLSSNSKMSEMPKSRSLLSAIRAYMLTRAKF
jgi:hypothetical protein